MNFFASNVADREVLHVLEAEIIDLPAYRWLFDRGIRGLQFDRPLPVRLVERRNWRGPNLDPSSAEPWGRHACTIGFLKGTG